MNIATVTLGKTEFVDRETTKITTTVHNELAVSLILKSVACFKNGWPGQRQLALCWRPQSHFGALSDKMATRWSLSVCCKYFMSLHLNVEKLAITSNLL